VADMLKGVKDAETGLSWSRAHASTRRGASPVMVAIGLAGSYFLLSVLWILLSDRAVDLINDPALRSTVQTIKGLIFVLLSSALIFLLAWVIFARMAVTRQNELAAARRLSSLLESVNDGVWEYDTGTGDILFSGRWQDLTGYPVLVPLPHAQWKRLIHSHDVPRYEVAVLETVAGRQSHFELEMRFSHKDGRWLWLHVTGGVMFSSSPQGGVVLAGAVTDLSLIKDNEEHLKRMVSELTRSEMEIQRFAFAAAHDLRQPVRQMGSYAQLLERSVQSLLGGGLGGGNGPGSAPETVVRDVQEYAGFIRDGAATLNGHLDSVLQAFEVRSQTLTLTSVDLLMVVDGVLAKLKPMIDKSGAEILCEPLPMVQADGDQIALLFEHLLKNALSYRSPERPLRIQIRAHRRLGTWEISVQDNGEGFPADKDEAIFQAFYRLHTASEVSGSGMGLTIARAIAEQHDGSLTATGKPGEGATFYLTLRDPT